MKTSGPWGLQNKGVRVRGDSVPSVLLVDDDASKRLALKAVLEPLGLHVVEADSGEVALRRLIEEEFAVILLDVRMPGMDGFETAALMRRRKESELTPIIFITAFAEDEITSKARYVEGAVDFMFAPVPPHELRAKVSVFVNLYLKAEEFAWQAQEVQASADQLRVLTDVAPIGIFRTDAERRFVYTNPRWTELTGVKASDALGRDWQSILATMDPPGGLLDSPAQSLGFGMTACFQIALLDRGPRVVTMASEPISDSSKKVTGWVGTLADITAEAGAQKERARYRSLVQNSRHVIAVIDKEGLCSYVSPGVEEVTGFAPDEVIGSPGLDFVHPDDLDRILSHLAAIQSIPGATPTVEVRMKIKGGGWVWIEIRAANHLDDPSIEGIVLNYHDIGARREAESERLSLIRKLGESEKLFRGAFDASQTGIALLSADGLTYKDVNAALCRMLGYSKAELLELGWEQVTHPDDLQRNLSEFADLRDGLAGVGEHKKRYVRKDGATVWAEVIDSVVPGPDGAPAYFVMHVTDVTERQASIQEKERLEGELVQAQKMEAVGQLAGGIAHDFNNILSVILNYADFASEGMDPTDPRFGDIGEISKAGEKAATLVHQLLAFSRKEMVEHRIIDLNDTVTGMHSMLSRSLGEDIDLIVKVADDLPMVSADPGRMEQVLLNLAVNARDAMPQGGVLTISTGAETIGEDCPPVEPGDYVCITVSDTGMGMDDETMDRIFDPFFTTKPRGEGTGMGLSSSHGILEQAGGCLRVTSEVGEGTTFTLHLPISKDAATVPVDSVRLVVAGGAERILLVEDEDAVRQLVSRILTKNGYDVVPCASGAEAIDYCRSNSRTIDLLLTDVVMPKMSGQEVSDRASSLCHGLRTLFMSGYTDELVEQRGGLTAHENLISKPFDAKELLVSVRALLDRQVLDGSASGNSEPISVLGGARHLL